MGNLFSSSQDAPAGATELADLPVFDLNDLLDQSRTEADLKMTCEAMAKCLHETSCLIVRDPRVSEGENLSMIALMQRYYAQKKEALMADARPEIAYQVGVTPDGVETAKCAKDPKCIAEIDAMPEDQRPVKPTKPDPKWRFFWRVGDRPANSKFPELNAPAVIPAAFADEWAPTLDAWGSKLLAATEVVAEMLAMGFGLERTAFVDMMKNGPHLLAPTGSDLFVHGKQNQIFAGYHNDLNFLTIHGKSNFPGLHIWLRNGAKRTVSVPDGCLLLQAGQQMEYVTGGYVKAGMHEVVVTPKTLEVLEARKVAATDADRVLQPSEYWRISTTMFATLCHDATLQPLSHFADQPTASSYPPILGGDQVAQALKSIGMADELQIGTHGGA